MRLNEFIQIGSNIKKIRKEKGISQKEMAEEILKIPRSTYSNYENNNRVPDKNTLEKIANALEVEVTAFLSHEDYERLTFETDFDFSELDPKILEVFNKFKESLSNGLPSVKITNSVLIQNIIINYLARVKAESDLNERRMLEEFMIIDGVLQTGNDQFNRLYNIHRAELIEKRRIESINEIKHLLVEYGLNNPPKFVQQLASNHVSKYGAKDLPEAILLLLKKGDQESGS